MPRRAHLIRHILSSAAPHFLFEKRKPSITQREGDCPVVVCNIGPAGSGRAVPSVSIVLGGTTDVSVIGPGGREPAASGVACGGGLPGRGAG